MPFQGCEYLFQCISLSLPWKLYSFISIRGVRKNSKGSLTYSVSDTINLSTIAYTSATPSETFWANQAFPTWLCPSTWSPSALSSSFSQERATLCKRFPSKMLSWPLLRLIGPRVSGKGAYTTSITSFLVCIGSSTILNSILRMTGFHVHSKN